MTRIGIEIGILVVLIRLNRLNQALREVQGEELREGRKQEKGRKR